MLRKKDNNSPLHLMLKKAGLDKAPVPDPEAVELHQQLTVLLTKTIAGNDGVIDFANFMQKVLYEPGLGYYVAGARKFGEDGDFITSPEISDVFAHCLANQCLQVLSVLKSDGDEAAILEFGPGSGRLCADLLQRLEQLDALPDKYYLMEVSPDLRQRQLEVLQESCPHLLEYVDWLDELPTGFSGVVLANEVLDAMPVNRFVIEGREPKEIGVAIENDEFVWRTMPASEDVIDELDRVQMNIGRRLEEGYESEINLWIESWMDSISHALKKGAVLLIDYGYTRNEFYHEQRDRGTIMCHYRHHVHDNPLVLVGLQDITAYVDFTAVADAGSIAGLNLAGFSSQAEFLIGCSLDKIVEERMEQDPKRYPLVAQQIKRLTMPGEMGERFKAIGFVKNMDLSLQAFSRHDYAHRL